jgi:hypothetical protein
MRSQVKYYTMSPLRLLLPGPSTLERRPPPIKSCFEFGDVTEYVLDLK